MAKKKKRGRQGWLSKLTNVGIIALGVSRVLEIVFNNLRNPGAIPKLIVRGATFGLAEGSFNKVEGLRFYTPVGAAAAVGFIVRYLRKKYPVRR